jgi:hypothetical protein
MVIPDTRRSPVGHVSQTSELLDDELLGSLLVDDDGGPELLVGSLDVPPLPPLLASPDGQPASR